MEWINGSVLYAAVALIVHVIFILIIIIWTLDQLIFLKLQFFFSGQNVLAAVKKQIVNTEAEANPGRFRDSTYW